MLLDIRRCGSGWGGAHGHWIIDVEHSVAYDVYNVGQFSARRTVNLPDISLLRLLDGCETSPKSTAAWMDNQRDFVYVLNRDTQQCVLDTDFDVHPENEALHGKLLKLIDYLYWGN